MVPNGFHQEGSKIAREGDGFLFEKSGATLRRRVGNRVPRLPGQTPVIDATILYTGGLNV